MTIYRDMDREALDRQYNLRAAVPGIEEDFARWRKNSADTRARCRHLADIPYGGAPGQKLDLFLPEKADGGPLPLHIFIHGGYWMAMSKADFSFVADGFTGRGIAVAVIDYDLCPTVRFRTLMEQVMAVPAWAWRHGADYGLDRNNITVSGHSAGGQMTALLAAADWPAVAADLPRTLIRGGVPVSGIYDLEPIRLCYLNETLELDERDVADFSPLRHLGGYVAPLICAVGGAETDEFRRQQRDFVAQARRSGHDITGMELANFHHFDVIDELAKPESPLNKAVMRLVAGRGAGHAGQAAGTD